jgi:hypothetical protein
MGALLAASVALTPSCSKDDKDDAGTYTPSANDNLQQLIKDANASLRAARQWSITETGTENGTAYKYVQESNADNKKSLVTEYEGNTIVEFSYTEGEQYFSYDKYESDCSYDDNTCTYYNCTRREVNEKELRRPSTNAEKWFMYNGDYIEMPSSSSSYSQSYRLNGSVIVVTESSSLNSDSAIYEVTLAADKRYKSVKSTSIYYSTCGSSSNRVRKVSVEERSFSYSANPSMPSGFNASQFTDKTSDYISAKVVWGEGKGESTFWEEKCDYPTNCTTYLYASTIAEYAPDVTGKVTDKFTANGRDYCASYTYCSGTSSIPVTEGMTITAVWHAE